MQLLGWLVYLVLVYTTIFSRREIVSSVQLLVVVRLWDSSELFIQLAISCCLIKLLMVVILSWPLALLVEIRVLHRGLKRILQLLDLGMLGLVCLLH